MATPDCHHSSTVTSVKEAEEFLLECQEWTTQPCRLHRKDRKVRHTDVGGVTEAVWYFVHLNRIEGGLPKGAIMMVPQFSRPLQTALDDTQCAVRGRTVVFETPDQEVSPRGNTVITGYASMKNEFCRSPVYDATKLAPDIGMLPVNEQLIWVEANSIFLKRGKG